MKPEDYIEFFDLGTARLIRLRKTHRSQQMTTPRRTALTMLGLVPATAVGAETFIAPLDSPDSIQTGSGAYEKERFAAAFEKLAAEIRRDAVVVESLKFESLIEANEIADRHHLKLTFLFRPEV